MDSQDKTPIRLTSRVLTTAEGAPMATLGEADLILRTGHITLKHTFIICPNYHDNDFIFGMDIQRQNRLSYSYDEQDKICLQQSGQYICHCIENNDSSNIAQVKSTIKIPPHHNAAIPVILPKNNPRRGDILLLGLPSLEPDLMIVNGIHHNNNKAHVKAINTSNNYIELQKGDYVAEVIPLPTTITPADENVSKINSITTKRMMPESVNPDTFIPPLHDLSPSSKQRLQNLLDTFKHQFATDETAIGTTPLTTMTIDTGDSPPVSQKPYSIALKHYDWVKQEIDKLLEAKVIRSSRSSWSAPIIVVPKGDGGKRLVVDYRALNKVTRKFVWPMP